MQSVLLSPVVERIWVSFYIHQTYNTAVSNNHNSQKLKFVSNPPQNWHK